MSRRAAMKGQLLNSHLLNSDYGYLNSQVSDTQAINQLMTTHKENDEKPVCSKRSCSSSPFLTSKEQTVEPSLSPAVLSFQSNPFETLHRQIDALVDTLALDIRVRLGALEKRVATLEGETQCSQWSCEAVRDLLTDEIRRLRELLYCALVSGGNRMDNQMEESGRGNVKDIGGQPDGVDSELEEQSQDPSALGEDDPYISALESQIERAILAGALSNLKIAGRPPCMAPEDWLKLTNKAGRHD
ncbi:hypothetical protein NEOLEDRAFT_1151850 [Neolentinus lepideus HHB14362 ss-1]|uniref:Uncharacterized protein n=1 Tax=Neolentinus lepideus HHB14362 ss-1 TaxID=1314782 RepID=A0A165NI39_9AGAM|nr:hypothetical protein NEOLEDRAFT_1151850 [Neolentinus lepideus HHB14362 ss-1]